LRPQLEHVIVSGSELARLPLSSLGIPPYDIVRVADAESEQVYLLAGDRDRVMNP
jgi:hypothetical protein